MEPNSESFLCEGPIVEPLLFTVSAIHSAWFRLGGHAVSLHNPKIPQFFAALSIMIAVIWGFFPVCRSIRVGLGLRPTLLRRLLCRGRIPPDNADADAGWDGQEEEAVVYSQNRKSLPCREPRGGTWVSLAGPHEVAVSLTTAHHSRRQKSLVSLLHDKPPSAFMSNVIAGMNG
jgi:hypothetical protein